MDAPHNPTPTNPSRFSASLKFTAAILLILATLAVPARFALWLLLPLIVLCLLVLLSRIPLKPFLKRLLLVEPVLVGIAAFSLLQPGGGGVGGGQLFALLLLRSTLCVIIMLLLAHTTPFHQIVTILRKLRVPGLLVTTLWLMHRYLNVLLEESQRMRRARRCRTFVPHRSHLWHTLSTVAGQLFIRSTSRAQRVYDAMCARGWNE